jgi:glycyl-tRNA synthetase alpha chain
MKEQQFSAYSFDYADVPSLWKHLELYEAECLALLARAKETLVEENTDALAVLRFPVLGAYELALKCSHTFNLLDARGAISVTERVGVMARIRNLIVGVAKIYAEQGRLTACRRNPERIRKAMPDFLLEIGLEEVPARMIASRRRSC